MTPIFNEYNTYLTKYKDIIYDIVKKVFPRYNFSKYFSGAK